MKLRLLTALILAFTACNPSGPKSNENDFAAMKTPIKSYLALGDSYTIGEGVEEADRYPNQLVKRLNLETNHQWLDAEIIAKTGWIIDELDEGIDKAGPKGEPYDLVTLLIGVNNQYRERPVEEYEVEFEQMLLKAIGFAGNLPNHVVVLSIPDWGITPFAIEKEKDQEKVAAEIDAYNEVKKSICGKFGVKFIDITEDYRKIGSQEQMLTADNLHPSGEIYKRWTDKLFDHIVIIYPNP